MLNNKMLKRVTTTTMVCLLTILLVMPATVLSTAFLTEVVSTESTDDSWHPSLAVDPDGNVHVAWHDWTDYGGSGTDHDVFYKAKIAGSWSTTEVVSTESTDTSEYPSLAVDPNGNVHVAWSDQTDYDGAGTDKDIFYKARVAGSWTTTEVVSTESTTLAGFPSLAVDVDGNVHVAWPDWTDYGGSGTDYDVFYKAKIGGSWSTTEVVSTESTENSMSPSLFVDVDGSVHVAWEDGTDYGGSGTDGDIFYKAKMGGSWTTTEVVSTMSTSDSFPSSLFVDVDRNVHVAWGDETDYGGAGGDGDIFYKAKIGGSWTTTEVVSTEMVAYSGSPSLFVDVDRNVHVAWRDWTDYGGSGDDGDIFYKAKIGGIWTIIEVVSTESTENSERPSLAVGPDGSVHVAWEDYTDYGGSGTDKDIFYKIMVAPFPLYDLMAKIDDIEAEVDAIEAKLDDETRFTDDAELAAAQSAIVGEIDENEAKLDILLERLGVVGGLMMPTDGLKLVIDLFINNAAAMILGILVLVGLPLLMRRVRKNA